MLRISVIVPTRDRPKDLADLLQTILHQDCPPFEVIIVDDSPKHSAKSVVNSYLSIFKSIGCDLKYVPGNGDGLPAARNLGVNVAKGDAILFLDDDTLLSEIGTIKVLAKFLERNVNANAVQPLIISSNKFLRKKGLADKLDNAVYKVMMLSYRKNNTLAVRRSAASIFPDIISKTIQTQRLSGCCCCIRRSVFRRLNYDTNLKRWGFMEDLDFSYRLYKKYPGSLYAIPDTKVIHKSSTEGRLPSGLSIQMATIYWFYVFFKDVFHGSIINLVAFLWAQMGNLLTRVGGLIVRKKRKREWWIVIWLLRAYFLVFKNLREVLERDLNFFNRNLRTERRS